MDYQLRTVSKSKDSKLLRQVAEPVDLSIFSNPNSQEYQDFQKKVDILVDTRIENTGIGIAGPQIGWMKRVFTVGSPKGNIRYPHLEPYPETVVVNPTLTPLTEETFYNFEKCLSVPKKNALIMRSPYINVSGYSREGEALSFDVGGLMAGIFQHEYDHLNGVLILDSVSKEEHLFEQKEFPLFEYEIFMKTVETINEKYASHNSSNPFLKKAQGS